LTGTQNHAEQRATKRIRNGRAGRWGERPRQPICVVGEVLMNYPRRLSLQLEKSDRVSPSPRGRRPGKVTVD
jgi:hypothetical protein